MIAGLLAGLRVGMHQRRRQARQRVQQFVLGGHCHLVRLDRAGTGVHDDLALGAELVADPVQPDLATPSTPDVARRVCSAWSTGAGSTASISRR
jgi:hypothetical protein